MARSVFIFGSQDHIKCVLSIYVLSHNVKILKLKVSLKYKVQVQYVWSGYEVRVC